MIVDRDLMVKLGLVTNFKQQVIYSDNAVVKMKVPGKFLVQSILTKSEMHKVVIQTAEISPTK